MSLRDRTVGGAGSKKGVDSVKLVSKLLRRHYETWSRLYVEQRIEMFESDG
ncbi:hypothetical protein EGH25_09755 [Haladaptatus sp. F3-133]|jgi:hypothetical protein|uniref:Uncharacterized protein n=1 Tax=Halorutilus salinus TaxID=2487751 RepID=A0A9Q4C5U4_9EURY|nr:hypothetical protein [Halorutilus salinus]MCX2819632.1 hypothetical protein [Halorutilus salinus]